MKPKKRATPRARPSPPKVYDYYATTVGGLEEVVLQDLRNRLRELRRLRVERGRRHGRIFFRYERSPKKLLELRSVDNLFALLAQFQGITTGKPGLRHIAEQVARIDLEPALALRTALHGGGPETACRLICTIGGHHRFSARELRRAVGEALGTRYRIDGEAGGNAHTLHLQVMGKNALFGLQLSRRRLRDRDYRKVTVPGGLEATVAYSMALLAEVEKNDVCLDPMCGSATTLIEAGLGFRPRRLIGGDVSSAALAAARENGSAAGEEIGLVRWDAGRLPLVDASVDAVLCNLPYGKKIAPIQGGVEHALMPELARVARPGRKTVLLAGERTGIDAYLETSPSPFALEQRLRLHLRGVSPLLYVLKREPEAVRRGEDPRRP